MLHEAHGTGPKLPKGRREIRRGIKPRKFICKTHIFFLQIPLLLHVLIICNHLYSVLAKPWKNLLKFNWYLDIKMCIRLLSNKMLMEWYVQTIVFFLELINLPFFKEQILITQGNIYLLQFSKKKKNDKGLPGLTKLLPLSMKSL